jgi:hypothetical protein
MNVNTAQTDEGKGVIPRPVGESKLLPRIEESEITWVHGSMETWVYGDMGTWRHGDMETWIYRSKTFKVEL